MKLRCIASRALKSDEQMKLRCIASRALKSEDEQSRFLFFAPGDFTFGMHLHTVVLEGPVKLRCIASRALK